ncbi:MAG TPA: glycosyltransferase family 2 protein [Flavitalea sp.]|nr:glycosyltransferase family 2 protein [Flavitalea sp.]
MFPEKNFPLDLTIAIPVKNEERNLPGCLDAIGKDLAKKIVIIDSGSTDHTKAVAKQYEIELIDFKWNGQFPKKRNWYLRNHTPNTKWILFLDADEYLTAEFKKELRDQLTSGNSFVGYWLKYTIYFMGHRLKGGYPLKKLALFQVGKGEYEHIQEDKWSGLDMEIHEHPILKGSTGIIKNKIDHQDFRGVNHYVNKHIDYADWEARRFVKVLNDRTEKVKWTWKQRCKYFLLQTVWIGPIFFLGSFVFLGGFRDGPRGLAFAILKMSYFNQVYCKIRELK